MRYTLLQEKNTLGTSYTNVMNNHVFAICNNRAALVALMLYFVARIYHDVIPFGYIRIILGKIMLFFYRASTYHIILIQCYLCL